MLLKHVYRHYTLLNKVEIRPLIILLFTSLAINAVLALVLFFGWSNDVSDDEEDAYDDMADDDDLGGIDCGPHHAWR